MIDETLWNGLIKCAQKIGPAAGQLMRALPPEWVTKQLSVLCRSTMLVLMDSNCQQARKFAEQAPELAQAATAAGAMRPMPPNVPPRMPQRPPPQGQPVFMSS